MSQQEELIEAEADTLEEARAWAKAHIPDGLDWLSEKIISDGKPITVRGSGETLDEATTNAQKNVPGDAAIQNTKTVTTPSRRSVTAKASNQAGARAQVTGADIRIAGVNLVKPGKKGFLGIGATPDEYSVDVVQLAVVEVTYKTKAKIAVTAGDKSAEFLLLAELLASGWPDELPRDVFNTVDLDKLLALIIHYQEMPHAQDPMIAMMGSLFGGGGMPESRPDYSIVNGKIARRSQPVIDAQLLSTAVFLQGRTYSLTENEKIVRYTMELIEHYTDKCLAKFLFNLPRVHRLAMSGANHKVVTIEEHLIDVYKGVENVLFEIYAELGLNETFDDARVTRKLLSIVERAKK